MASQQGQPIDLDAFDQDASTLGLQGASPLANAQSEPASIQPIFNFNSMTPTSFPIQTIRFPVPISPLTASGYDPLATPFPPFMAFRPAPSPIPIEDPIPNPAPPIPPNPTANGEAAAVTRGGRGSRGGRGGGRGGRLTRGRGGNTSTSAGSRNSPAAPPDVLPAADPSPLGDDGHENWDDDQPEVWPRKRNRNRNMNIREKLVLIRECVEHADEYRPGNKTKFWAMISELLKQQTGYELISPQQTVTRWVKARIDELVEEEMGSGTEVERNDFKTAVETFSARMETVAQDIDDALKTRQQRAAENLEAARLENSLIFQLDDEPIPGIDAPPTGTQSSRGSSIALGHRPNKRKREAFNHEPSSDAVLLANSF